MDEKLRDANRSMHQVHHMHRRVVEQLVFQNTGISHSHHFILMYLADSKFDSQKELARIMSISPAAVTMALKKLEKDGYIIRTANPDDTRFNNVSLSEKGVELVNFSKTLFENIDQWNFDGFSEEELQTYISLNNKILSNLTRISERKGEAEKEQ